VKAPHGGRRRTAAQRRIATTLGCVLGCAVALPSCTFALWRDDRSLTLTAIESAPAATHAYRLPGHPQAIALHLSPAAVQALREHAPELPPTPGWLRVRVPWLTGRDSETPPRRVNLVLYRDAPGEPPLWTVDPPRHNERKLWYPADWRELYERAACDVSVLAEPPAARGAEVEVTIACATRGDDGKPVLLRVALTPLMVAGDCVLVAVAVPVLAVALPIAWLAHTVSTYD
jgi:hypothetical protein